MNDAPANASQFWPMVRGTVLLLVFAAFTVWLAFRVLKRSADAGALLGKWVATLVIMGVFYWKVGPMIARGGGAAFEGLFIGILLGLVLAVVWRQSIAGLVAEPFGNLYDGGRT